MDLKQLGTQLIKFGLPALGTALAGAPGTGVGALLAGGLLNALGLDSSTTPEELLAQLQSNPEMVLRAKKYEYDHQEALLRMQIDAQQAQAQAYVDDMVSARQREVATQDKTTTKLAWLIIIGAVALNAFVVLCWAVPGIASNTNPVLDTLIGTIVGYAVGEVRQVTAYYFGGGLSKPSRLASTVVAKKES